MCLRSCLYLIKLIDHISNFLGDRNKMSLPKEASIIHAEYIYYYYPSDVPFPRKYILYSNNSIIIAKYSHYPVSFFIAANSSFIISSRLT